ncbi:MAG: U32 family peptidase [Bacteroidales bacterium]|nr:U32 family peptidase [Bacteroidales bacterium]
MQLKRLELLAPAKTCDIGIAAIDCGADAVYIAGPGFGARVAAGNPVSEIARLCAYAHKFSARIYTTVNTIVFENELAEVEKMIWEMYEAGVDALIVQDLGITRLNLPPIELHASTQCAIRTSQQAAALASLGFKRLILERQLSLEQIRAIRDAIPGTELEFFVHGAICVCYSGNCYLSQYLTGRSANRGACIQACRSFYDVVDSDGRVLAREKSILSPKDYRLDNRLEELADAGICSFKIEGRLKNDSYVKNLCRHYRGCLDELFSRRPEYAPASSGTQEGGFTPNPDATFNRGYTEFFIDGRREAWNSLESTKSLGEYIGTVQKVDKTSVLTDARSLSNGDGLVFVTGNGIVGMRADVVTVSRVTVKDTAGIAPGDKIYRNYNIKFERQLQNDMPRRKIDVGVEFGQDEVRATDVDGFCVTLPLPQNAPVADKQEAAADNIRRNLGKRTDHFDFRCEAVAQAPVRFYPAATLNALRRELAEKLTEGRLAAISAHRSGIGPNKGRIPEKTAQKPGIGPQSGPLPQQAGGSQCGTATYTANCANHLARGVLLDMGYSQVEDAYEIAPKPDAELMRSRYCVKYELGLCPKLHPATKVKEPLYLLNGGNRLRLQFDCKNCEMIVTLP